MSRLGISSSCRKSLNMFLAAILFLALFYPGRLTRTKAQGAPDTDTVIRATERALDNAEYRVGLHTTALKGMDGVWAVTVVRRDEDPVGEPFLVLLAWDENEWKAILPEQADEYNAALSRIPATLIDPVTKEYIRQPGSTVTPLSGDVSADTAYTGFYLPWEYGQKARVVNPPSTQGHVNQIDYNIWVGSNEFLSGNIAATKDGTVIYTKDSSNVDCDWSSQVQSWVYKGTTTVCPWTEANLIVLQHVDGTYSWYLHLAQDSIPTNFKQPNALVSHGDIIGVEGSTGWAEGVHLHFMVTTDYYMGLSGMPWGNNRIQVQFTNDTQTLSYSDMVFRAEFVSQNSPGGGNHLPNVPIPISPADGSNQFTIPELCWEDTGDPDDDPLTFLVSLSGPVSQESGWIPETCWTPASLPVGEFTWLVRAKDDSDAESSASPDRTFTFVSSSTPWFARYFSGNTHWVDISDTGNELCSETLDMATLDKDYGDGPPCVGASADGWVGDYRATVDFLPGDYVFLVEHDDGLKLYLDGESFAARDTASAAQALCPSRYLSGEHELMAILREDTDQAKVKVTWSMDTSPCSQPAAFTKSSPENAATNQPTNPTLSWMSSDGATSYKYCYTRNENGPCDMDWKDAGSGTNIGLSGLSYNATYYWQVQARNDNGTAEADGGSWWSLTTLPQSPIPLSPSGTLTAATPTFQWGAYPNATSYKLAAWSDSASAYVIQAVVLPANCDGVQCSYPSPINLANGSYKFKVMAFTPSGATPYSNWLAFAITGVTIPPPATPPILVAPNTTADTHRPTFQWNAVEYATFYRLAVYSYDTKLYVVVENVYPTCTAGVCSYTPATWDLVNGSYGFKMRSRNSSGYTDFGAMMKFSVSSNLPVAPTLLSPSGTVVSNPPAFNWNEVGGATRYQLLVYSLASGNYVINTYVDPTACSGGGCTYTPASALAGGGYKFKMSTESAYGSSGYSAFKSFTVP